jgi:hypothetical protein
MSAKLKTLKALSKNGVVTQEPPKLEAEPPHRRLARLTEEQDKLVREIQSHKQAWADRNQIAQQTHQPPATPEITAFKQHHRDLSCRLAAVNLEIGATNREIRQHKAEVAVRKVKPADQPASRNGLKLKAPIKRHVEFPAYFLLAAEAEMDPRMFSKVESVAKSMLRDAMTNGLEES